MILVPLCLQSKGLQDSLRCEGTETLENLNKNVSLSKKNCVEINIKCKVNKTDNFYL